VNESIGISLIKCYSNLFELRYPPMAFDLIRSIYYNIAELNRLFYHEDAKPSNQGTPVINVLS